MYRLYTKISINGHFSVYTIDTFLFWIQCNCLTNMVFGLDPSNNVIKRLLCINCFGTLKSKISFVCNILGSKFTCIVWIS